MKILHCEKHKENFPENDQCQRCYFDDLDNEQFWNDNADAEAMEASWDC